MYFFLKLQIINYLKKLEEDLHRLVFRHSELIVETRSILGPLLGTLPELTRIVSRERNDILLAEVTEDSMTLAYDLSRAERNGHVHATELPLHPCAPVEPDVGVFSPLGTFFAELLESIHGCLCADPVGSVRIGEVAGHEDHVRLELVHELFDYVDVHLVLGIFLTPPDS